MNQHRITQWGKTPLIEHVLHFVGVCVSQKLTFTHHLHRSVLVANFHRKWAKFPKNLADAYSEAIIHVTQKEVITYFTTRMVCIHVNLH